MTTIDSGERRGRSDIQALRGYAVLLVILYHTNLGLVPFGFLGVDIFFVISGYLITGIIARGLRAGTFGFEDFYLRRVRRLFPAAFVTLTLTLIGSVFLLTSSAWQNFAAQLYGALFFATNIVLWQQINYFKSAAELEPLLHMWSLAVEEQYYLVLPVVLRFVPQRLWGAAIAAITLGSLGGYIWLYPHAPGAAFYLLPTRAWEIGIGAIVTFLPPLTRSVPARRRVAIVAALLLVALPFAPLPLLPSHLLAIPAALAAAALLYVDIPQRGLDCVERPLGWFGNRSYSLYLLHWPIFALTRHVYLAQPLPLWLIGVLLGVTVGLAALLYRTIEEPIRRSRMPAARIWTMLIVGTALLASAGWLAARQAAARPALDLAPVRGLDVKACQVAETPFAGGCAQSPRPTMLIWGDSLSEAITPAIDASTDHPIVQASMGQCAPLLGVAPNDLDSPTPYGQGCIAHNQSVLDYAVATPSIRVVVLTGAYLRYAQEGTRLLTRDGTIVAPSIQLIADAQARLTRALRLAGKRIVVIAPPPQAAFDIGSCWERARQRLPTIGAPGCALIPATRRPEEASATQMLAAFERAGTPLIPLDRMICPDALCPTEWQGRPLYRDGTHLSRTGSVLIGQRFRLGALAWETAR